MLTFDDVAGADGYAAVPTHYGGLDWSAAGWSAFIGEQAPYTPHSGEGRATNGWGSDDTASTIRFLAPTVFDGAWFAGYGEASVRFDLYLGGQLVASSSTLGLSDTPAFLARGWDSAIDAVGGANDWHAFYVMDDFRVQGSTDVPEPGTLALGAPGLGLALRSTRRRRA